MHTPTCDPEPEPGCGQDPLPAFGSRSVVVPLAVVTSAELTVWSLGHHAANHPFWSVACTWLPSPSTSVAAVTPVPTRPSANEYESPLGVRVCDDEDSDPTCGRRPGRRQPRPRCATPAADTAVSDGPEMHEA